MKNFMHKQMAHALVIMSLFLTSVAFSGNAQATLATDLQALLTEANSLKTKLAGTTLTADNICGPLKSAKSASSTHINNIATVNSSLASPITLDTGMLTTLDSLSSAYVGIGSEAVRLSTSLNTLSASVDQLNTAEGISLMLALSDDIGTMADRIGEMADRILVMSDNIGLMADRIITTQNIQSSNLNLTLQNTLTAQTNVINLVSQIDTSVYNTDLLNQLSISTLLETDMNAVVLTAVNSATELARIETSVASLKSTVTSLNSLIDVNAVMSTMTVNQQSMITLADLSGKVAALATALKGYTVALNSINSVTATPTLAASVDSILNMSSDIGLMANSIGEEADLILEMADNIGLQADQIVLTQQLQSTNIVATESALLSSQVTMINLIVKYGL
jgi:hypothetical protein